MKPKIPKLFFAKQDFTERLNHVLRIKVLNVSLGSTNINSSICWSKQLQTTKKKKKRQKINLSWKIFTEESDLYTSLKFFPLAYSWLHERNEGNTGLVGKKKKKNPVNQSHCLDLIFFEMEITFSCFYKVIIGLQIIKFLLFVFRLNSKHLHYIEL